MKQQKNQPQTPPKVLANPSQDEIKRAENEGMTAKPIPDINNLEHLKGGNAHSQGIQGPAAEGIEDEARRITRPWPGSSSQAPQTARIEGEGSYTAAQRYRAGVEQSVQKGDSEKLGEEAADAIDGPEGADLRHAEQRGMMTPPGVQDQQQQGKQKQQGKPKRGGDNHQPVSHR
jgi:hypothetical protein